ncbi:sulfotransferase family protein [Caenispirillum salinarum]|uniref:sulfotransferase family protein n=1 Tax=Caenispirillum salinarum TaxID=859058 RepID=UPI00384F0CA6
MANGRSNALIFVSGAARSGTTLMRSLLSAHSRIIVPPETHFFNGAAARTSLRAATAAEVERFIAAYANEQRFHDLGIEEADWRRCLKEGGAETFAAAFSALMAAYGQAHGKPRVGEKTPNHVAFIDFLLECYPDCRIIVLRRDPRGVVASQLKSPWVAREITPPSLRYGLFVDTRWRQLVSAASQWTDIYGRIIPAVEEDPRVFVLSYETLVGDAEGVMRRVCDFIGESFEPAMLAERTDASVPRPAASDRMKDEHWRVWRERHHSRSLQPVSTDSLERWRSELAPLEVAAVEAICAAAMGEAGYGRVSAIHQRGAAAVARPVLAGLERLEGAARQGARAAWRRLASSQAAVGRSRPSS